MTKTELHKELNEACATLLGLCLLLGLPIYHKALERSRSFMSKRIDLSDFPSV